MIVSGEVGLGCNVFSDFWERLCRFMVEVLLVLLGINLAFSRVYWWVRGSENRSRRAVRGPEPCRDEPEGGYKRTPKTIKDHSRVNGASTRNNCCHAAGPEIWE